MATLPGPRVLSIRQPWAWAIAAGRKKLENRTWRTPYRGPVFIHASMRLERHAVTWLSSKARVQPPRQYVFGSIIAVATLKDVVTRSGAKRFRPWFFGPYGLVFTGVRALRSPIKTRGRLGLYRASPALIRAVSRQVQIGRSAVEHRLAADGARVIF